MRLEFPWIFVYKQLHVNEWSKKMEKKEKKREANREYRRRQVYLGEVWEEWEIARISVGLEKQSDFAKFLLDE